MAPVELICNFCPDECRGRQLKWWRAKILCRTLKLPGLLCRVWISSLCLDGFSIFRLLPRCDCECLFLNLGRVGDWSRVALPLSQGSRDRHQLLAQHPAWSINRGDFYTELTWRDLDVMGFRFLKTITRFEFTNMLWESVRVSFWNELDLYFLCKYKKRESGVSTVLYWFLRFVSFWSHLTLTV